jgi:hypothetical protein
MAGLESTPYSVNDGDEPKGPSEVDTLGSILEARGLQIGEATGMYGDIATAEEYGYVSRG